MKKVLIIGGGFAGLTAAAYLSNSEFKVEIIEASKKLGGQCVFSD
jgi:phytoene dehydrogenase-like protein